MKFVLGEAGVCKIHDISCVRPLACTLWNFLTIRTFKKGILQSSYNHKCYFHTIILRPCELCESAA